MFTLVLILTTACSAGDVTPVPETGPTNQELQDTINEVSEEVRTLQHELEGLKSQQEVESGLSITLYQGQDVLGGDILKVESLMGEKPVILNFWAAESPPSVHNLGVFQSFYEKYGDRVLVLGVDVGIPTGQGTPEQGMGVLAELGITFPAGYTKSQGTLASYGVTGTPTTIFINEGGDIHDRWTGALSEEVLTQKAEEMLAEAKQELRTSLPTPQQSTATTTPIESGKNNLTGICYRTPELQELILEELDVELCHVINSPELFRIRSLAVDMPQVKEGDFEGLVNVDTLRISTGHVEPNGLRGLENVKKLQLIVKIEDGLVTESFSGLGNIEELRIKQPSSQIPELPDMPNLKYLQVYSMRTGAGASPFRNLSNLERLELRLIIGDEDTGATEKPYEIPVNLLEGLESMKEVTIDKLVTLSGHEVQVPEELFKYNILLERVDMRYPRAFYERKTFYHLDHLQELKLLNSTHLDPVQFSELELSRNSPLYMAIKRGDTKPGGYLLVE